MDHRSFAGDLRIPSITRMMLSMSSSMSLGQPLASSFFDKDQTPLRVEFWTVGRKVFDVEAWVSRAEFLDRLPLVPSSCVWITPPPTELPWQCAQKRTGFS